MSSTFPAKILLFGEYGIIKGSKGLALPFNSFSGNLKTSSKNNSSNLKTFHDYLKRSKILTKELDILRMESDIHNGLYFESNIPQGYGIGSSGSLCAALFSEYSLNYNRDTEYESHDLGYMQELMAMMESFYHGTSSGLDPLISYVNRPVLIQNTQQISMIETPNLSQIGQFYLLDTKVQRKTAPLIHQFLKDCSDEKYNNGITKFINLTNLIIDNFLLNNKKEFIDNFNEISRLQYLYFENMIPNSLKDIWLMGLESREYFLKLCGAGGGGYFLLFSVSGKVPLDNTLIKLS